MIILGIDPGTASTGYGVIEKKGNRLKAVKYGLISTTKNLSAAERLYTIHEDVSNIIKVYSVEAMAVEKLFFNKNVKTALAVGEARGVILLAGVMNNVQLYEYTPLQVKMALTGYGRAEKDQVGKMVKAMLCLKEVPKPDDTADALAIALTYASFSKYEQIKKCNVKR
jgi:crossover junction endodeoxyribonuclease RuvC